MADRSPMPKEVNMRKSDIRYSQFVSILKEELLPGMQPEEEVVVKLWWKGSGGGGGGSGRK